MFLYNAPDYVKQRVGDMEKRMEGIWKDYADQMKGMSREQRLYLIDTERNSDLLGDLLSDQYFVDKLAERNLPLVKRLISQFKGTIKKSATVDSESIKYLKKLVNRFEKALDNAQGGVKISQIGNADDEREEKADSSQQIADSKVDDERKSVFKKEIIDINSEDENFNPERKSLTQQLEESYSSAESFDQRYIHVGKFSNEFRILLKNNEIDLFDYPIAMNYRDAYLSMHSKETGKYHGEGINYHDLGVKGLREALESLKNPVNIMKSKKDGKIEIVLQSVDKKGNSNLCIVAINQKTQNGRKFLDAHIVTTVYGRRNIDRYVAKAEEEGRLIKSKKKRFRKAFPKYNTRAISTISLLIIDYHKIQKLSRKRAKKFQISVVLLQEVMSHQMRLTVMEANYL